MRSSLKPSVAARLPTILARRFGVEELATLSIQTLGVRAVHVGQSSDRGFSAFGSTPRHRDSVRCEASPKLPMVPRTGAAVESVFAFIFRAFFFFGTLLYAVEQKLHPRFSARAGNHI